MALFTDASAITINDLLQYEGTIGQVASDHDINVDTKIALATSAIGDRMMLWLLNIGASDPQFATRPVIGLSTVVLTDPLRRWLTFEALSRIFSEAYDLQLNTRFQSKWREYNREASSAAEIAFQSGIGIVFNPLPRPALPLVSEGSGPLGAAALYVQTTWVDIKGAESASSPINGLIVPAGTSITVAMAEGSTNAPAAAAGWNVYVGVDQAAPTKQNQTPNLIGQTWQLPTTGIVIANVPGQGQMPNFYIRTSKQILRG